MQDDMKDTPKGVHTRNQPALPPREGKISPESGPDFSAPDFPLVAAPIPTMPPPPPRRVERDGAARSSRSSRARSKASDEMAASALRERCRQLYAATFFREQHPVRSLGFTSAIRGEGKTYLARMTATVLADE